MDALFHIWPLRNSQDERTYRGSLAAHRHDYQEIIVITKGRGHHRIDWDDHILEGPRVLLVAQGKMHDFRTLPGARGWVLEFASDFTRQPTSWLFSRFFSLSVVSLEDEGLRRGVTQLCGIMEELQRGGEEAQEPIAHLLEALLAMLQVSVRRKAMQGRPERSSDFSTFEAFMTILDSHFRTEKEMAFYARALRINPRRLAAICKQTLGLTPLGLLEQRTMVEAKRLLARTGLTVQQIGFDLGYEDPSYFTKVFRKVVRQTPSAFRKAHPFPDGTPATFTRAPGNDHISGSTPGPPSGSGRTWKTDS
jgi:AraC-like DNA-binding protein